MKLTDIVVDLKENAGNEENLSLNKTPSIGDTGDYITTSQAAKLLGVTASRVRQLIMDGKLKSHSPNKGRRDNLLKVSEVQSFKNSMSGKPGPQT